MTTTSFSRLTLIHMGLTLAVMMGFWITHHGSWAASFGIGAGLMQWSCLSLAWVTRRVLDQKEFAWTVALIVIKYAVLLATLYFLTRFEALEPFSFVAGIFSFMIAALSLAALESQVGYE